MITIFKNSSFGQVRVSGTKEEPLFCLADVCRALGINNASQCKTRLKQDEIIANEVGVQTGTKQDGTPAMQNIKMSFITERNLYKCIFMSRKKEAEQFQDWITDEVLPTIRKTGGYVANTRNFVDYYFSTADETTKQFLVSTLDDKRKLIEENEAQQKIIEIQTPKAEFYDEIIDSKDTCDMNTVAKTINCGIGRNRLFAFLRSKNVLLSNNQPSQYYIDLGWFRIIETKYSLPNGDIKVYFKTVVYQKGIEGIRRMLNIK